MRNSKDDDSSPIYVCIKLMMSPEDQGNPKDYFPLSAALVKGYAPSLSGRELVSLSERLRIQVEWPGNGQCWNYKLRPKSPRDSPRMISVSKLVARAVGKLLGVAQAGEVASVHKHGFEPNGILFEDVYIASIKRAASVDGWDVSLFHKSTCPP